MPLQIHHAANKGILDVLGETVTKIIPHPQVILKSIISVFLSLSLSFLCLVMQNKYARVSILY